MRWRTILAPAAAVIAAAAVVCWFASAPDRLDATALASAPPGDALRGEQVFWAGGCASCHAAPGASGEALLSLGGGVRLDTPFGVFVAPNVSPDPRDGIGGWSFADFANALMRGVAPDGTHLYPAFPYTSYARMTLGDAADLHAFMKTLPAVEGRAGSHEIGFPYSMRRGIGLWKRLFLTPEPVVALAQPSPELARGRYLVEALGHCGECHTPRNFAGGPDTRRWLAGAPAAAGQGKVPNITPGAAEMGNWSEDDIAEYLKSGFTPDFDSAGGAMAEVVLNTARLTDDDRRAIAAYLKAVPAIPD